MNFYSVTVVIILVAAVLSVQVLGIAIQLKANEGEPFEFDCTGKEDGNYPHPNKCTHYVACVGETYAYEQVCALNHDGEPLHYVRDSGPVPRESRCDYPEVANCDRCSTQDDMDDAPFTYDCSGKQDGNYPHPTKCTHFVACVGGQHAYEQVCALNHNGKPLHYVRNSGPDPRTSRCDYPETANVK
ncbi:unnamed protein product [Allacma fusca]|uniref:Chitin-binding type-2 domain-containing protein n=1 Tax=Allacma fusca TaxID=39272 RepID=A0A8J2PJ43_9HEXA|nr:unnamed protein product [Allacma fusca]